MRACVARHMFVLLSRCGAATPYHHQIGSDVAQGEVILPAGHHLLPAEIGILAGSGAVTVKVGLGPHCCMQACWKLPVH